MEEKKMTLFTNFLRQDEGVTALEYGLIASLIAVVIIAAVTLVGTDLRDLVFKKVSDAIT